MHDGQGQDWRGEFRRVRDALSGFRDRFTCNEREELQQQAAVEIWRFCERHGQRRPVFAVVRTISSRTRWRAIQKAARDASCVRESEAPDYPDRRTVEPMLRVDGRAVPTAWLLAALRRELELLCSKSRSALLAFYEGRTCAQIAESLGVSKDAVKVRLHRGREQLKKGLEARARAAGCFEA